MRWQAWWSRRQGKRSVPVEIQIHFKLPLFLLGIVLVTAVFLPDRAWNTLLIGVGGLFLIAFLWTYSLAKNLHISRKLRFGWVSIGDRLSEAFELRNSSFIPALWVEINDESTVPGYDASIVQSVGAASQMSWRRSAVCLRRGQYLIGPWSLRCGDPFGIFSATRRFLETTEIIIHPPIHSKLPIPLPSGKSAGRARARQRAVQATINAATVREYQPGDPFRWIHWRSTAHQDKLAVREFDLDAAGDFWLVLDLEKSVQLAEGPAGTEEHAVLLAASMAAQAIRLVRNTGIAAYGRIPHIIHPGVGEGQLWQILRVLALVNADGAIPLTTALRDVAQAARPGSTALIVTPNGAADWLPSLMTLAKRGVQGHVVLLDRPSFGGEGNSEGLRDAIQHLGFAAQIIRQGEIGVPAVAQKRRGFWEFQVTPMGRAIIVQNPLEDEER
ncbi:MAG: DUF58 domain-containing protein [Chloroflexi bacterium]|nr:DUF58 domain-containing protein [Chloroflexota bacterium]